MSSPTPAPTGVALTTSSPRPTMHQHTCHVSHVTCHAARVTCHVLAACLSTCCGGRCEQRPGAGNLHPPGLVTRCQDAPLSSVHSVQCPQCPVLHRSLSLLILEMVARKQSSYTPHHTQYHVHYLQLCHQRSQTQTISIHIILFIIMHHSSIKCIDNINIYLIYQCE